MGVSAPETSSAGEYSYVDKTTGRVASFTPKSDEAMVTFRDSATPDTLNEIVEAAPLLSVSQGYNLQRGFAAVYVNPTDGMAEAARSLEAAPEVASSMPVLIDENGASRYFLPDELTVQFRPEVEKETAGRIIEEHGSRVVVEQRTPGYYTLAVPEGRGLFEMIREFSELEEVVFAEPSEAGFNDALAYIPDDPDFGRLWGLRNTGQTVNGVVGTAGADIDATEAWDLTRGDPEVIIAVIDTGADMDHDDLEANIFPRGTEDWDFADTNDSVPEDNDSHGSHVAGTAAGEDNTVGVIGVAPGCRIMPLRINLTAGMNQNRADAINYVATQAGANPERRYVINCSWRMNGDHTGVRTAIQNAVNQNVVVVFAAGNNGVNTDTDPQFPGVYPEVIAVAALDQQDRRAGFSNFGTNVDVAAPGVNIWSSVLNNAHGFLGGTSMASPHAAGVAALIWSRNRNLTNQQVRWIMESSCDNIDATNPGNVGTLGAGRINAFAAVTSPQLFPTHLTYSADLTGDGRADIVGFGDQGVWVSLNQGNGTFGPLQKVVDNFAYDAGGWRVEKHPRFLADLTGDRRADIVGFGTAGVWVSLNKGDGSFQALNKVVDNFAYDAGGWRVHKHPRFVVGSR
jgi:subtilisin family serine protease